MAVIVTTDPTSASRRGSLASPDSEASTRNAARTRGSDAGQRDSVPSNPRTTIIHSRAKPSDLTMIDGDPGESSRIDSTCEGRRLNKGTGPLRTGRDCTTRTAAPMRATLSSTITPRSRRTGQLYRTTVPRGVE
ncbi:MAG: hypothetical protein AMXMBFR77_16730 [Phycisphaerales bacterium]